jgi:integral membrane protein
VVEGGGVNIDRRFLAKLRRAGMVEGVSTLILFGVAMPLKYLAGMPLAVTIAGSIHGFLFLMLVTLFVMGIKRIPISRRLAAAGVFAAIVPFGPFVVDRWLSRVGNGSDILPAA